MATGIQIVIEARDPHTQAAFWAEALGYDVEDATELITAVVKAGHASDDDIVDIDGRLFWRTLVGIQDPTGTGPRLLFQAGERSKSAKNRVHLDVTAEDREEFVAYVETLGGSRVADHETGGFHWTIVADPEGNEFCVSEAH